MPKSPVVNGYDLLKILGSLGYTVLRQRGSHVQMAKSAGAGDHTITVPDGRNVSVFKTMAGMLSSQVAYSVLDMEI